MRFGSGFRQLERTMLVVHLKGGDSLQALLKDRYRDSIVLSEVVNLDAGEKLLGEIVVPLDRIDYYQTGTK